MLGFRCTASSVSTPAWISGSQHCWGRGTERCCRIIGKQGLAYSIRVDPWRDSHIYFLKKISASCVLLGCTEPQSLPPVVVTSATPPRHRVMLPHTVSQRKSIPSVCSCQAFCQSEGTNLMKSREGELKKPVSSGDTEDKPIKGQCQAHAPNFSKFVTRGQQLSKHKYIYMGDNYTFASLCQL